MGTGHDTRGRVHCTIMIHGDGSTVLFWDTGDTSAPNIEKMNEEKNIFEYAVDEDTIYNKNISIHIRF